MISRYSQCHFAEAFAFQRFQDSPLHCSHCGEECELIPDTLYLEHDLELTLRRWKDGDCSLDEMFKRVNDELYRSWKLARDAAAVVLQGNEQPKYRWENTTGFWQEQ